MAKIKIDEVVAEYQLKDLASKNAKKIKREIDTGVKSVEKLEKSAKKADTVLSRMGRTMRGSGAGLRGRLGGAGRMAGRGAGALGGMGRGLAGIPLIGGMVAAAIASIQTVKSDFVSGLALKKELLGLSADIQNVFGKKANEALKAFDTSFATETQQKQLISGLAGRGVTAEQLSAENLRTLETFAKAQGKDLENVFTGMIKSGAGLNDVQKLQAQQFQKMIAAENPFTARQGFTLMMQLLKQVNPEIEKFAKSNQKLNKETLSAITITKELTEQNALMAVTGKETAESMKAFEAGIESEKVLKNMAKAIAGGSAGIIKEASDVVNATMREGGVVEAATSKLKSFFSFGEKEEKRASGGPVKAGHQYKVNERGQEMFIPSTNGKVVPHHKAKGGGGLTQNNYFTINGDNGNNIRKQIEDALDNAGRSLLHSIGEPG